MRDIHLRFRIDRSTCQRSHLPLVFCECLQVIIHKGDTDQPYEISPMYRESLEGGAGDAELAGSLGLGEPGHACASARVRDIRQGVPRFTFPQNSGQTPG
jgi:hypothetical protein